MLGTLAILASLTAGDSAFDRLKALAGTWEGDGATVTYKVTAGGSAVVETLGPGTEKEMITVYHLQGEGLALTHYCMLGNRPRMSAPQGLQDGAIRFACGGEGLRCDKDAHMHSLVMTFQDKDHVALDWTLFQDGKAQPPHSFKMARKKE